jgi:hypothetical protein
MLNGILTNFHPFKTPNDAGSVVKALQEMKKSKYAHDSNGRLHRQGVQGRPPDHGHPCRRQADAPRAPGGREEDRHHVHGASGQRCVSGDPDLVEEHPISSRPRWGKDYADPSTFIDPLFNTLLPAGNTKHTRSSGSSPPRRRSSASRGNVTNVRSIAQTRRSAPSTVGDVRPICYAAIDRKLTTQIVPWIPYLWRQQVNILAPNVTKWTFDQNAGLSGFGHVAVGS